jgi:aspartate aminotransferase
MKYSRRTDNLRAEGAYQVLGRAQALEVLGRDIIHLEVGQPDFDTLTNVSMAGIRAITTGQTRYTPPSGMPALRAAIAQAAGRQRGLTFSQEQVVISPGAKPNLFFPTMAVVDNGDEVIYPDPGFPTYEAMVSVAGGVPVPVPIVEEKDFSFDMDAFDRLINERTRLIVINSPSNPTGGVLPMSDLERIAEAAIRYDAWVLSDEIYAQIAFDGLQVPSIATLPGMQERTIIMDGFSKTYAMTGWRLGYGIMPVELARRMDLLLTHSVGCTAQFTQVAGLEAITGPQDRIPAMAAEYQRRRDAIVEGLNNIPGVSCRKPQGAFYAFPNVKSFGHSSSEIANIILEEGGVALLPGSAFGKYGEGYLRLSFANSIENIQAGLERMTQVLKTLAT